MRRLAKSLALLASLAGLGHAPALWAAACANVATGTWSAAGTWAAPCNVAGGPTAADDVSIINGSTVTVDAAGLAASSVTIATGNANTTLTFAAGSSLAVTNNVIIDQPTANNRTKTITALTGTLTVGGNVTLTGGTTAIRDALLTVSSGLITIDGGLIIDATVATSSTASITAAGGRITVNGAAGVSNGDVVSVGVGIFSVTNAAATFSNSNAAIVATTTVSSGQLNVTGALTNGAAETITISTTGSVTAGGTLTNNGTVTLSSTGTVTASGTFANGATGTMTTGPGTVNAATFTNDNVVTVSTGLINVTGDYTNAAAGNTVTISNVAGRLTVGGTLSNGGTVAAGPGTVNAPTFTNNNVVTVSTGLIDVTGAYTNTAAGDTVTITGAGGRLTVGGTLTNTGSIIFQTAAGGIVNANGDFVSSGIVTNTTAGTLNIAGNATVNGTFTAGAGAVVFNGAAGQTLDSTAAITFNNLTISTSGASSVSIACATPSPTVSGTLALTSGNIITSGTSPGCLTTCPTQEPIIVAAAGTITGGSSTSYVQGALRKIFNAATLNFRATGDEFPVGDASNYTPVEITAGTTSTAGNVTACVIPTEHPQVTTPPVASGGIDAAKSVNRYWSLATSTINTTAAPVNAIFKFAAGDVDAGATTGNFIVQDWNGTSWGPTTLVAAGGSSTQASNIDLTSATNDIAIGEPLAGVTALPGNFNAFDTGTPAGAVIGPIQTKQSGAAFSVRLVRLTAARNAIDATYNQAGVTVELLDSSDNSGALNGATACRPIGAGAGQWSPIAGTSQLVTFAAGVVNTASFTVNDSYRDVRVHIVKAGAGAGEGCSTDLFAIRPQSLTITALDQDWQSAGTTRALANIGASGGNVHKASAAATPLPFTLRATPVPASATNYDGTPTTVAGFPDCTALGALCTSPGTLSFTAGSWATVGGVRENATAAYSEAGAFNLQLEDTIYANVDVVDGTPAAARTVPATASAQIGRFVPDHFDVTTLVAPAFRTFNVADAACSAGAAPRRAFTYIGQPFGYLTTPQATVLARNAGGATTTNYAGTLWKIGGATPSTAKDCTTDPNICQFTTSWSAGGNSSNVIESYTYALIPVSTPNWDDAGATPVAATVTAGTGVDAGTGIITYASSDTLAFLRNTTTAQAPFTASITNTISVQDTSEADGAIATTTAAAFGGITFDSGDAFRFGRLRLSNALGTELLGLPVRIETQYWNGTAFATNIDDHCTNLTPANITLGNYQYNGGVAWTTGVSFTGPFSAGLGDLKLSKPSPAPTRKGSVDVTVDLAAESKIYLQGAWTGTPYTQNPTARATFGVYKGANEFIYMREMY